MKGTSVGELGRGFGQLFGAGSDVGLSDGELLGRFARRRDAAAEAAFQTLLARHGAMVLGVCRHVLGDAHAAEDAFQATFLVLVRRAGSFRVREPGSLGPWLHGVAYRTALKARREAVRRRAREHRAAVPAVDPIPDLIPRDELELVHEEVCRLPAMYRAPVVLCYFEGRTHDEAAAALRWPVGTVRGRLARARDLLRARLDRRGLATFGPVVSSLPGPDFLPAPPRHLLEATAAFATRGSLLARLGMPAGVLATALMLGGLGLVLGLDPGPQSPPPLPARVVTPHVSDRPPPTPAGRRDDGLPEHARVRLGHAPFNHGRSISQVFHAPDGKSLVAIDGSGSIRQWETATGRLLQTIGEPSARFREIAPSPDGRALATLEDPDVLRLWDIATGREVRRWHDVPGYPRHLTFSPDGRRLASALSPRDPDGKEHHALTLWDLNSPSEHRRRFAADWRDLHGLAFTPDSKGLITGSTDTESRIVGEKPEKGSTRLWDVATGRELRRYPVEGFEVRSVAVSPDGKFIAAGVSDQTIRVYDQTTGRERTPRLGQDHALQPRPPAKGAMPGNRDHLMMTCLAFSPDGSILASGSSGTGNTGSSRPADIYLWDVARGKELRHFSAQQGWISGLSFSPDGRTLASAGPEPMIRLWEVATGREVFRPSGHRSGIRNLVVSPTDATIFTTGQDGTIRHWDAASGRELGVIARFDTAADTMAVSPDGKALLVGGHLGGRFALWSIAKRREIRSFPRVEPRNPVRHVAFSPDGKAIASERRIWDVATGRVLVTFRDRDEANNRDSNFFPVFYSPDGTQLVTPEKGGVRIWDIASGREARWAVRAQIHFDRAALSPDGRYLATGGLVANFRGGENDPLIRLWELASGQEVVTFSGLESSTFSLAFSPDGRLLASGGGDYFSRGDTTVHIWEVATGRELRRFQGHLGIVNAVAFTPDGRSVVSASGDASALVWDVSDLKDHPDVSQSITAEVIEARWRELAGSDARTAYRATWALSVPGVIPFLAEHLRPATTPDPQGIPAASGPIAPPEVLRTLRDRRDGASGDARGSGGHGEDGVRGSGSHPNPGGRVGLTSAGPMTDREARLPGRLVFEANPTDAKLEEEAAVRSLQGG